MGDSDFLCSHCDSVKPLNLQHLKQIQLIEQLLYYNLKFENVIGMSDMVEKKKREQLGCVL